ncbi:hypothetical protein [Kitasatospora atroaurantiaca]|nr:hypothetical protein [Kitasatospora atroaurantiaca]
MTTYRISQLAERSGVPTALQLEVRAPKSAAGMLADLFGATP